MNDFGRSDQYGLSSPKWSPSRGGTTSKENSSPSKSKSRKVDCKIKRPEFRRYIAEILKRNELKIRSSGMGVVNKLVESVADDLWKTAVLIAIKSNRKTVQTKDARTATQILLTRGLYAESEAAIETSLEQFERNTKEARATVRGKTGKLQKKPLTRSERAGLVFSVSRVEKIGREKHLHSTQRVSNTCAVYISAVLEFITNSIIKSSEETRVKEISLTSRHFLLGIASNTDLTCLLQDYHIINAGVIPTAPLFEKKLKGKSRTLRLTGGEHDLGEQYDENGETEQEGGHRQPANYDEATLEDKIRIDITKPGVVRLMRRAGVLRVGNDTYDASIDIIQHSLDTILKAVTALTLNKGRSTVGANEVDDAADILNAVKQTDVFKRYLQGPCIEDMSNKKKNARSPKSQAGGAEETELVDASKRRSRPGQKTNRDIKKYQKTTELLLQPTGFSRIVRLIGGTHEVKDGNDDYYRYRPSALRLVQSIVENYLVGIFQEANKAAAHAKRVTLLEKDIRLTVGANELSQCT
jgi:histone H3/H4